jgi:Zn-dependent protease with chaperone function
VLSAPRYLCLGVVAWLIFQGASCALQRWHEAEADRFAVRLTWGEAVSLDDVRVALTKINESGLNDPSPPYLFQMLFNDHPSLRERLRNIEAVSR